MTRKSTYLEKILGELDRVECSGGHDQLQLRPRLHSLLQQAEEDVRVDGALVSLVQHDAAEHGGFERRKNQTYYEN